MAKTVVYENIAGRFTPYDRSLLTAVEKAQEQARTEGGRIASFSDIVQARLVADGKNVIWHCDPCCATEESAGRTPAGNQVCVVTHGAGILINPEKIRLVLKRKNIFWDQRCQQSRVIYTSEEFKGLLEGRLPDGAELPVFSYSDFLRQTNLPSEYSIVIDYDKIYKSAVESSEPGVLAIARVGNEEKTSKYLAVYQERNGKNSVFDTDSVIFDFDTPCGKLLKVRSAFGDYLNNSKNVCTLPDGNDVIGYYFATTGIKNAVLESRQPGLEQVLKAADSFVPERFKKEFRKEIEKLF